MVFGVLFSPRFEVVIGRGFVANLILTEFSVKVEGWTDPVLRQQIGRVGGQPTLCLRTISVIQIGAYGEVQFGGVG